MSTPDQPRAYLLTMPDDKRRFRIVLLPTGGTSIERDAGPDAMGEPSWVYHDPHQLDHSGLEHTAYEWARAVAEAVERGACVERAELDGTIIAPEDVSRLALGDADPPRRPKCVADLRRWGEWWLWEGARARVEVSSTLHVEFIEPDHWDQVDRLADKWGGPCDEGPIGEVVQADSDLRTLALECSADECYRDRHGGPPFCEGVCREAHPDVTPEEIARIRAEDASERSSRDYYFGCIDRGHYLWRLNDFGHLEMVTKHASGCPWEKLDGHLAPQHDEQSRFSVHRSGEWTAIACWSARSTMLPRARSSSWVEASTF